MYFLFRPMYAVRLNGQIIGYTDSKKQLVERINKSIKTGDGNDIAFFEIDVMPEYEECYSKRNIQPNEEEVFLERHIIEILLFYRMVKRSCMFLHLKRLKR